MSNGTRWVGLDVHASQTACAMFDAATGEVVTRRVMGRPHEVLDWLIGLDPPVRAVYEAGATGYGLARRGRAAGVDVQVCAPGMIVRASSERIERADQDRQARRAEARAAVGGRAVGAGARPDRRARAAAGPGALSRGRTPGPDARPPPDREVPAAPRALLRRPDAGVDARAPRVAGVAALPRCGQRGDVRRLPARPRRSRAATRWTARSTESPRSARGRRRSLGCAVCTASTRSAPSACAPRSATSRAPPRRPP